MLVIAPLPGDQFSSPFTLLWTKTADAVILFLFFQLIELANLLSGVCTWRVHFFEVDMGKVAGKKRESQEGIIWWRSVKWRVSISSRRRMIPKKRGNRTCNFSFLFSNPAPSPTFNVQLNIDRLCNLLIWFPYT